jgi:hypothetical protein
MTKGRFSRTSEDCHNTVLSSRIIKRIVQMFMLFSVNLFYSLKRETVHTTQSQIQELNITAGIMCDMKKKTH